VDNLLVQHVLDGIYRSNKVNKGKPEQIPEGEEHFKPVVMMSPVRVPEYQLVYCMNDQEHQENDHNTCQNILILAAFIKLWEQEKNVYIKHKGVGCQTNHLKQQRPQNIIIIRNQGQVDHKDGDPETSLQVNFLCHNPCIYKVA
jgi:hypothetical protein